MARDVTWGTVPLNAQPGDLLLALTDGVPEAMNGAGKSFGRDRLATLFDQNRTSPPEKLLDTIDRAFLDHMKGTQIADDSTVVVVRFS
jgi:sigma-B regulation protein RsbU (phosphoserine phosphatase)